MQITELIEELEEVKRIHGDMNVYVSLWEGDSHYLQSVKMHVLPYVVDGKCEFKLELGTVSKVQNKTLALISEFKKYATGFQSLLADAKGTIDDIVENVKEV